MFYYIDGVVEEILPQLAVLDCGGVGYALNTSANSLSRLQKGKRARLYTYLLVREDCFELYGFADLREKRCFEMLIGVSGVGPRAALSILSAATPESLAMAVIAEDAKMLTVAPGIGKKIAQRVILELKDKIAKESGGIPLKTGTGSAAPIPGSGSKMADAAAALGVLGYSGGEISAALKDMDMDTMTLEEVIKLALWRMMK